MISQIKVGWMNNNQVMLFHERLHALRCASTRMAVWPTGWGMQIGHSASFIWGSCLTSRILKSLSQEPAKILNRTPGFLKWAAKRQFNVRKRTVPRRRTTYESVWSLSWWNTAYSLVNTERSRIGIETPAGMLASSHLLVELPSRVYNLLQSPYLVAFWRSKGNVSMAPPTRLTGGARKKKKNRIISRPRGPKWDFVRYDSVDFSNSKGASW